MHPPIRNCRTSIRRGAAAVEFAMVAPVFVALIMGTVQAGYNFEVTTKMLSSIRQSGRLATLDGADHKLLADQSLNSKILTDIRNSLTAEGLPGQDATVTITHADGGQSGSTFDLTSASNDLQYFRITVSVPYSAINTGSFLPNTCSSLSASVVFRKGTTSLIQ
jgi:Flp pilus assembly protein TadG